MTGEELTRASILVVDDEQANLDLLEGCLAAEAYESVTCTTDPREALALFLRTSPDLVLLDLHMPHMDGFTVMEKLAEVIPADVFLPILVLTADVNPQVKRRALSSGATDFLTKPLDVTEVLLRIRNLLETRRLHQQQREARETAQRAERRAQFLAEASRVLTASLDYHTTLASLARLAVPEVADYCTVDMRGGEDAIERVGLAHVDPACEELLRDTAHLVPSLLPPDHPIRAALVEGRSTLAPTVTPAMIEAVAASESHRSLMERLAPHSLIAVPLQAGPEVLGAMMLAMSGSGREYGAADLRLAEELARRAAGAIESARLYQAAQEATRARDEMLGVVAHDLRNPLGTVMMVVDMLVEEAAGEQQRRHLAIAKRSTERMARLIQDLLEVTRLDRGKFRLERRADSARAIVEEALAALAPLAAGRGVSLEGAVPDEVPPVYADAARILQVLSNLVGNAIKFTPSGGSVRIRCEGQDDAVRFAVADTGPGIPPDQLPHIFGRYWQASDTDGRGIGLGLSIAKSLVEAHEGKIWVESRPAEGSTFYFTIPAAPPRGAGAAG